MDLPPLALCVFVRGPQLVRQSLGPCLQGVRDCQSRLVSVMREERACLASDFDGEMSAS